jgi:hypothetical protein
MRKGESYICPNSLDYLSKLKNGGPDISLQVGAGRRLMEHVIPKNVHTVQCGTNTLRVRRRAGHEIYQQLPKPSNTALQHADVDGSAEYRMRK